MTFFLTIVLHFVDFLLGKQRAFFRQPAPFLKPRKGVF